MNKYTKYAIISVIITITLWALSFLLLIVDKGDRGTYGDMFGPVNALFSGLAFAGLIITLVMQHEELGLQRNELIQTNKELAAQREQFTAQTKTMQIQRFENTLFNMLSLLQGIVNSLDFIPIIHFDIPHKGKYIFEYYYNRKISGFQYNLRELKIQECTHDVDIIHGLRLLILEMNDVNAYRRFYGINIFDSYFRHLYRIFKYIDESPLINNTDRYEYSCIARAQLSEYELLILFYYALTIKGELKFKRLIEKYTIFINIEKSMLARGHNDYILYNEGAYVHQA